MTNSVAKTDDQPKGEVQKYSDGILEVIERAVRDPGVDVDKMERLFALQERALERQAKADFTTAKLAMQPELPIITMKGRIVILKKGSDEIIQETPFARFEDIHEVVMPILQRHGFDLKFKNTTTEAGKPVVTTILEHIGGHSNETEFELPMDTSGSKNNVQAVGSSTSYGKRYGTISILNLRVHGDDDDGVEGGKEHVETISGADCDLLKTLIANSPKTTGDIIKAYKIKTIDDLPASELEAVRARLNKLIEGQA